MNEFDDDTEEGVSESPELIAVFGEAGVGKTIWASGAPRPYFLALDRTGATRIPHIARNKRPIESWEALLVKVQKFRTELHSYQTLVLDTLDRAEFLCWEQLCQKSGVKSIEEANKGYNRGYVAAYEEMRRLFGTLESLVEHRQMHVVVLMHQKTQKVVNSLGADYIRFAPKVDDKIGNAALEVFDHVLYATRDIVVTKDMFDKKRERAIGGTNRILRTSSVPG